MAVFRMEKIMDYIIMANNRLLNTGIALKAKSLFPLMVSLSEKWDSNIKFKTNNLLVLIYRKQIQFAHLQTARKVM